jgi:hypothetical protein
MNFPRFLAHQVIGLYNIYLYIVWHDSFGKLRTGLVVVLLSLHKQLIARGFRTPGVNEPGFSARIKISLYRLE